jgi:hypothetical protein
MTMTSLKKRRSAMTWMPLRQNQLNDNYSDKNKIEYMSKIGLNNNN